VPGRLDAGTKQAKTVPGRIRRSARPVLRADHGHNGVCKMHVKL